MGKKTRPLLKGNLFGTDAKEKPWKLGGSAKEIIGVLDREPTRSSRKKKKRG